MARPRIFDENRKGINIYLHNEQYEWLKKHAIKHGMSPSNVIRDWIQGKIYLEEMNKRISEAIAEKNFKIEPYGRY